MSLPWLAWINNCCGNFWSLLNNFVICLESVKQFCILSEGKGWTDSTFKILILTWICRQDSWCCTRQARVIEGNSWRGICKKETVAWISFQCKVLVTLVTVGCEIWHTLLSWKSPLSESSMLIEWACLGQEVGLRGPAASLVFSKTLYSHSVFQPEEKGSLLVFAFICSNIFSHLNRKKIVILILSNLHLEILNCVMKAYIG